MSVCGDLCEYRTADGETMHGLLFEPREGLSTDLALLLMHGVAMNFYTGPLPTFARALAERGYHALTANNRGHDWVARAGDLFAFGGASHELFEDSPLDFDAALEYLSGRGYRRFVLFGHSLGAVKAVYYQGTRQRPDVVGVISCSAPRQFYSARAEEQPDFKEKMAEAEAMVERGEGDQVIWAMASGAPSPFTARTFVSKYGRHERNDIRPLAAKIGCPLLAIAGEAEHEFFPLLARELAAAAGPELAEARIVEGSDHFYHGHEAEVIDHIATWLTRFDA
jgi:pimeloyl-ACP methyl ester carboxylesterase